MQPPAILNLLGSDGHSVCAIWFRGEVSVNGKKFSRRGYSSLVDSALSTNFSKPASFAAVSVNFT